MAVMEPTFTVECDGKDCGEETTLDATAYAGDGSLCHSWGVSDETLEAEGWERDGEETYCPECVATENYP